MPGPAPLAAGEAGAAARPAGRTFRSILAASISAMPSSSLIRQEQGRRAGSGFGGFRDIFSNMFGGRAGRAEEQPEPGTDLEYQVQIGFWDAIRGTVMRIDIQRQETCTNCHGRGVLEGTGTCTECGGKGQVTQTSGNMRFNLQCPRCGGAGKAQNVCPQCHGEGAIHRSVPLDVRIKPGTRDGQRIRLAGKGNAGQFGGPPGDLYIIVRITGHPVFKREGDDIYVTVPVRVSEAALGAKIEVPTIDGRALLKIPPGTQSAQKLRLREKGVPSSSNESTRGDEFVEVKIVVPVPRDEETKEVLRRTGEAASGRPAAGVVETSMKHSDQRLQSAKPNEANTDR